MLIASYGALGQRALDQETPDREELREIFTVVTQAAMDGGDTVKRLLLLARAPLQGTEAIDLTLLVREVVQLTAPRWRDAAQGEGRPIRVELATTGHPIVIGSPGALRDALMNLILNAVDALPTGGTIHVRSAQRHDQASVEIADDGIGMSPEVQSKIFEPFFTTKGDKGTGLGLATVFGVVERHGGQVRVHSAVGKGTSFRLSFPTSNLPFEAETPTAAEVKAEVVVQRQLRILAVDDEPALTKAVVRLLRPVGHLVTTAKSGEEAIEQLEKQAFDLVLSDVGMGAGMSGWELAELVRANWPAVRFVLATGWGAGIDPVEARTKGVAAVLAKPYSFDELKVVLAAA
jgi:CheY-like chemotaxis protein